MTQLGYGAYERIPDVTFADAIGRVKEALAEEGFGVLAEMDVGQTLETKLGEPFRPYVILGACNPALAKGALEAEPHIGLLLPCNVVVQEDEGGVVVSIVHPRSLMTLANNEDLENQVADAEERLHRVMNRLVGRTTERRSE